ncbi:Peptidoglycan-binding (PGRP) domain of peptidoglycan hydrolases-containing protein [Streptomyces sp. WMMB 322]|nr:Peptidoglycan-binding (PGRP) domain of peptidoglycan hydrolases-containing protein [Streptomyces sp. WMMB 322]
MWAVTAALVVTGGAAAGCKAQTTGNGPIHVTKTSVAPAPTEKPARSSVSNSTQEKNPDRPAQPPKPAKRAVPADPVLFTTGSGGAQVRELQARLRKLQLFDRNPTGYYGPVTTASVRAFQRRQGMSAGGAVTSSVWSALRARTSAPSRDELYPPTARPLDDPDPRCLTGRALCVSKKSRTLAWYVNGRMLSAMDVRFGSAYTPTREGKFSVGFKSRDHVSTIYDTPMPYALFFSGGQAIHYSSDFAARGYAGASHGCVNVRDKKKIAALFAQVRKGDKVVVYK